MHRIFFLFIFLLSSTRGHREGESCIDDFSHTKGRCTMFEQCVSARNSTLSHIKLTYCSNDAFGEKIVCCLEDYDSFDERQIWGNAEVFNDRKRVSERKCEEYSRSDVKKIPLIPNPESFTESEANCEHTGVELIVGGVNAKRGEFPHMAAIGWADFDGGYKFSCSGSLISPRFVLTAAHCNRDSSAQTPQPVIVRLGDQNIDNNVNDGANPVDVVIRQLHIHPEYLSPKLYNNIMLLELVADVKFRSGIRAACLWTKHDLEEHQRLIATGWGVVDTPTEQTSKELQKVSLTLLDVEFCNKTLKSFISHNWMYGFLPSQLCADELRGGKDTCQGDSGAPLQVVSKENSCIFNIVAVTSFGKKCAVRGTPAVYTRVSSFLDWIESVVWPGE